MEYLFRTLFCQYLEDKKPRPAEEKLGVHKVQLAHFATSGRQEQTIPLTPCRCSPEFYRLDAAAIQVHNSNYGDILQLWI